MLGGSDYSRIEKLNHVSVGYEILLKRCYIHNMCRISTTIISYLLTNPQFLSPLSPQFLSIKSCFPISFYRRTTSNVNEIIFTPSTQKTSFFDQYSPKDFIIYLQGPRSIIILVDLIRPDWQLRSRREDLWCRRSPRQSKNTLAIILMVKSTTWSERVVVVADAGGDAEDVGMRGFGGGVKEDDEQ